MQEYVSPVVGVEEFGSCSKPMEGAVTGSAGFIMPRARGPDNEVQKLMTNCADLKRKFGGCLPRAEFKDHRFTAYAAYHFFINEDTRVFIMRMMPHDSKCA